MDNLTKVVLIVLVAFMLLKYLSSNSQKNCLQIEKEEEEEESKEESKKIINMEKNY